MDKNVVRNISKYSQKLFDHPKHSITDALKAASKRENQKTAEASSDLIGNKIADNITRTLLSRSAPETALRKQMKNQQKCQCTSPKNATNYR